MSHVRISIDSHFFRLANSTLARSLRITLHQREQVVYNLPQLLRRINAHPSPLYLIEQEVRLWVELAKETHKHKSRQVLVYSILYTMTMKMIMVK